MIAKERKLNGAINVKHFDKEIDNLIDENTDLKIENKRLKKIISSLRAKVSSLTNKSNARKQPVSYQPNYMKPTKHFTSGGKQN